MLCFYNKIYKESCHLAWMNKKNKIQMFEANISFLNNFLSSSKQRQVFMVKLSEQGKLK